MPLIEVSTGQLFEIDFVDSIADFESQSFYRVRDQDGNIVQPPPEIYAELLTVQLVQYLIRQAPDDVYDQGILAAQGLRQLAILRAEAIDDVQGLSALFSIGEVFVSILTPAFAGGSVAGPAGIVAGGAIGVFGGFSEALATQTELRIGNGAERVYTEIFGTFASAVENSIARGQALSAVLDDEAPANAKTDMGDPLSPRSRRTAERQGALRSCNR